MKDETLLEIIGELHRRIDRISQRCGILEDKIYNIEKDTKQPEQE